jgi:hypothetical protein
MNVPLSLPVDNRLCFQSSNYFSTSEITLHGLKETYLLLCGHFEVLLKVIKMNSERKFLKLPYNLEGTLCECNN